MNGVITNNIVGFSRKLERFHYNGFLSGAPSAPIIKDS